MNASAGALRGGDKSGAHPVSDALAGAFGCGCDQGVLVAGEPDASEFGARVFHGRSTSSHGGNNSGHRKFPKGLDSTDFSGHNKWQRKQPPGAQPDTSPEGVTMTTKLPTITVVDVAELHVGDVFVTAQDSIEFRVTALVAGRIAVEFDHPWYPGETAGVTYPVMPGSEACAVIRRGRGRRTAFGRNVAA